MHYILNILRLIMLGIGLINYIIPTPNIGGNIVKKFTVCQPMLGMSMYCIVELVLFWGRERGRGLVGESISPSPNLLLSLMKFFTISPSPNPLLTLIKFFCDCWKQKNYLC